MAIQDAAIKQLLKGQIDQGVYNTQANAITGQVTDNFNTNVMPGMMSGAMAAGNFGSSRQGIAQGLAASRMNQDLGVGLAGLSGSMYNTAQGLMGQTANNLQGLDTQKSIAAAQRAAQMEIARMQDSTARYGIDNQSALGWGGLANNAYANETGRIGTIGQLGNTAFANDTSRLGTMGSLGNQQYANETSRGLGVGQLGQQNAQWNQEFNRQVFNDGWSQNSFNMQQGMDMLDRMYGYSQGDLGLGTTVRNAPLDYLQQFTNLNSAIGRGGQTTTQTQQGAGGNPVAGALGGAQLGKAAQDWWGGSASGSDPFRSSGGSGFGWFAGNTGTAD